MPDDQTKEEIAEQPTDQELPGEVDEALAAFMEDEDDETPGGDDELKPDVDTEGKTGKETGETDEEDEPDPDKDKKTGKKSKPKKESGKELEKETGETEKKETLEYPEALSERLKAASTKKPKEPPETETPGGDDELKPDEKKTPTPVKTKDIDFENLISLPDEEIKIGDHSINLKEYKKDYPEDFAAIMAVGSMIAKNIVEQQLASGKFVKADAVGQMYDKIQDMEFWDQISEVHADARKINKSDDFLDWLDEQEEPLQRLARNMETPEDGILIIDFYKKSKGEKKASEHDAKARDKKKKSDNLHKGTMRNKQTVTQMDEVDMNDAEAAFNEDD